MKPEARGLFHLRTIRYEELPGLLALYRHLHPDDPELPQTPELERHWQQITENPLLHYFVSDHGGQLVSTCTLTVIPNLTRAARPYGLIENVVTHQEFRQQGLATSLLQLALSTAWDLAVTKSCFTPAAVMKPPCASTKKRDSKPVEKRPSSPNRIERMALTF